ncbi:hypothetical protein BHE74_00023264 [Ensete ventricosum]|uniref:Uncharacterized protein n=1 Tax=Ensete ventricosum TaxID=4639 RepID=A0A427AZA5_ENSVE|nr:hypothetical protein B296_00022003 [Ensete ventricosum]RWW69161.1 hypothetical protein BHE74_00023264 [Ensete ventricosum]RZR86072.1 hypothetical protein BHM03_00013168 [Ensete ventricosum]
MKIIVAFTAAKNPQTGTKEHELSERDRNALAETLEKKAGRGTECERGGVGGGLGRRVVRRHEEAPARGRERGLVHREARGRVFATNLAMAAIENRPKLKKPTEQRMLVFLKQHL